MIFIEVIDVLASFFLFLEELCVCVVCVCAIL